MKVFLFPSVRVGKCEKFVSSSSVQKEKEVSDAAAAEVEGSLASMDWSLSTPGLSSMVHALCCVVSLVSMFVTQ